MLMENFMQGVAIVTVIILIYTMHSINKISTTITQIKALDSKSIDDRKTLRAKEEEIKICFDNIKIYTVIHFLSYICYMNHIVTP